MLIDICESSVPVICDYWDKKFNSDLSTYELLKCEPDFEELKKSAGQLIYFSVRDKLPNDASIFQVINLYKKIDREIGIEIINNISNILSKEKTVLMIISKRLLLNEQEAKEIEKWAEFLEKNIVKKGGDI